ncbi:electron transfer flavoprotein subunit alpha/FixB family protein [Marinicella gelatinilytica]|uniref:electron transfer flavoprotein subunit alpha/FixB family protein n=1 Tax=Marinicella gelatinilytica TaxID=2996017 RepID=UPI002260C2E5|nr:electron transfer flavoprotein subunit alpha/FixB family protein [Marinicella gelatinilytica]MCX7543824.1 electron transfer flavoprotein subunit alpha/FixB family protein [Marinicella gelatinilytica]
MSKVLILAEHNGDSINQSTAKVLTAAKQLKTDGIDMVLFVPNAELASELAQYEGVSEVHVVSCEDNHDQLAASIAPTIADLAQNYSHIWGPSTTFGKDIMPRVAALLGVNQISDIMEVIDNTSYKRPIYAGNAIITVSTDSDRQVATVRTASYEADKSTGGSAEIKESTLSTAADHTTFVKLASGDSDRPDLQTASKVISGGRGVGSKENFDMVFELADKIGAATGASRAAVDAGYVPNDMQVGQTGKIIAPDLYMCFGISGAIQHLTGIKDAGTIVAINKDADAPIFEVADIGLVGDLFKVIPEMIEKV